ncbi:MAG: ion transporter [Deltaproteobacteria bacterium]|nr:ion transporter [Deltaproteobacteria bacterium]
MPSGFRETIQFYLIDCKTVLGKLIDIAIILLNLIVCATFAIETYPVSSAVRQLLWNIEVVIVLFFIIEYVARLYAAKNRLRQLTDIYSVIDLIAIIPTLSMLILPAFGIILNVSFLKLLRIFRVFRIFRFLRFTADPEFFFGRITMQLLNIIRLFLVILIIFFISSGLFFYVESGLNPGVKNFGDAFYFTVVSLTTVGFGDIVPISDAGKWVTVLIIISGIILIPWQISRIVREWVHVASKKESVCSGCGLRFHDMDASHCKSCGHIIFQEYDGD